MAKYSGHSMHGTPYRHLKSESRHGHRNDADAVARTPPKPSQETEQRGAAERAQAKKQREGGQ
jgi:hypothetical protein